MMNNDYLDHESEPFRVEHNVKCIASYQWNQWLSNYASATNNSLFGIFFFNSLKISIFL